MFGNFVKRGVNMAVLGLAALTFFLFPIGGKTPFQHAVAVFTSRPAREAGAAFASAGRHAAASVRTEVKKLLDSDSKDPPKRPAEHTP